MMLSQLLLSESPLRKEKKCAGNDYRAIRP